MLEKQCTRCLIIKSIDNFCKGTHSGYSHVCRQCKKEEYQFCRDEINKIKSQGCSHCGFNKSVAAIDFHHLRDRELRISQSSRLTKRVIEEMSKCILLCSNCHRMLHNGEIELTNVRQLDLSNIMVQYIAKSEYHRTTKYEKLMAIEIPQEVLDIKPITIIIG